MSNKMMKNAKFLMLPLCICIMFAGCKDDDDPVSGTDSPVEVIPAGSMPAGTVYYFYEKDAATPAEYDAASDGTLSARMTFGTYAMLGVNTNVEGVTFDGMDDFSTAKVSAKEQDLVESRADRGALEHVGNVYTVSEESFMVEEGKDTKLTPTPQLLTKTITLGFNVEDGLLDEINWINPILYGIHSSVCLATGQPTEDAVANCNETFAYLDVAAVTRAGANMQGTVSVLGIQKPTQTLPDYTPKLLIYVVFKDGTYYSLNIDLTETLEEGDLSQGTIELPIVDIMRQGAGLAAEIGDWETPDASELDPDNDTGVKI